MSNWLESGTNHIWLPYTQMQFADSPLPVVSAHDSILTLDDGRQLVDGTASWWSVCHGYQHPHLVDAMKTQLETLSHVMFAGLAHEPAYRLASRLAAITPEGLHRVFFSDSGSTAVEVAMKMAVQFWSNQGNKQKNKFISFSNGYHGDTMGCMSLADPKRSMHSHFHFYTPKQYVVDIPSGEYGFAEFENLVKDRAHNIAGLIIEPLVQGAGGMKFHSPDVLAELCRICKQHDILFIADEIMTGFGRTGSMFACDEAGITPDIMCVGKALTGGMISLAATLATDAVFDGFLSDELTHALMHGPTYMANPLACAAANASLDLFESEPRLQQVANIEAFFEENLPAFAQHANVKDVRIKGAIGVIELKSVSWDEIFAMRKAFVEQGIWLRPFGNIIYIMPSFTITKDQLTQMVKAIDKIF